MIAVALEHVARVVLRRGRGRANCVGVASRPDRYIVWSCQLFVDQVHNVLETQNPADAVAEADRLLADWPMT